MPRLTGHLGSIYLNTGSGLGTKVTDTHNWTMEMSVEAAPCPIKGEIPDTYAIGGVTTRITCERYVSAGSLFAKLARAAGAAATTATLNPASGAVVGFELRGVDGDGANFVVNGEGIVVRGNMGAAHNQLLNDTLEIMCYTLPAVS